MNTAVVNVKVDPKIKKEAQEVAKKLGMNLSSLINGYLREIIKTKTVSFSAKEEPSAWLIKSLKESKKDIEAGKLLHFSDIDDSLSYLDSLIKKNESKSRLHK